MSIILLSINQENMYEILQNSFCFSITIMMKRINRSKHDVKKREHDREN
jgi:hypothetical protein